MLKKLILKPINIDCFLIELRLNVKDVKDTLINDIEKGVLLKDNNNNITNVKGQMTSWKYFNNNKDFHKILDVAFDEIKKNINLKKSYLIDSWGIIINKGDNTDLHNHSGSMYSGIVYLNDSEQPINFPQYNLNIVPKEGTFLFFSSFLDHGVNTHKYNNIKYAIPFNFIEKKSWAS
jgi:hypothetical protein